MESLVLLVAGSIVWAFRDLMVGTGSSEATGNARFAISIFGMAAVNGFALVPFLLRQRGWGWLLLVLIQGVDLLATMVGTFVISSWWGLITAIAATTIGALYLLRRGPAIPVVAKEN